MTEADRIREHIATVSARGDAETNSLIRRMQRVCWPGGAVDRIEPSARRWLQRWRPARATGPFLACSCSRGHCPVCN
jgi:hypothetical protein